MNEYCSVYWKFFIFTTELNERGGKWVSTCIANSRVPLLATEILIFSKTDKNVHDYFFLAKAAKFGLKLVQGKNFFNQVFFIEDVFFTCVIFERELK